MLICSGVNVRMSNIFKTTPEMMSLLSTSGHEETPLGILDESPPTNALSQTQVNINTVNQIPSTNDPFSISKNRINGDVRAVGLFERLNGKKANVDLVRPDPHVFDTPTGPGVEVDDSLLSGKEDYTRPAAAQTNEPPLAPARKGQTVPGVGLDFNAGTLFDDSSLISGFSDRGSSNLRLSAIHVLLQLLYILSVDLEVVLTCSPQLDLPKCAQILPQDQSLGAKVTRENRRA